MESYITLYKLYNSNELISRSQAKIITKNLTNYEYVTLDFTDIEFVGQGFLDEIFRIFQNGYPDIKITYCNINRQVSKMIKHVINTK